MRMHVQLFATTTAVFMLNACDAIGIGPRSVEAGRPPTFKEREALTAAMPAWLRRYPVGCVWLEFSLSKNGRYAAAGYGVLQPMRPPCLRYVSNGSWFLKKHPNWRIIFTGSDPPPCSLRIPRELAAVCLR